MEDSMTTIFTPPAGCSTSWTYEGEFYNSETGGLLIQNALEVNTRCFPDGFENYGRTDGSQVFSPGWCADGYRTAGLNFGGTVTTAICCPSQFSYSSTLTTPNGFGTQIKIFAGCVSTYPKASPATAVPARANNDDLTTSTITGPVTMWAQPMTVAYNKEEMSLFTTPTASSTETSSIFPLITGTPVPTEPDRTSDDSGLSSGAKAGIGVGAAAAGLLLIGLALFLFRRFQRKSASSPELDASGPLPPGPMNELAGSFGGPKGPTEFPVSEAEAGYLPAEMQASMPLRTQTPVERQELPA